MFNRNDIVIANKPNSDEKYMCSVLKISMGITREYMYGRVLAPTENIGDLIVINTKYVTLAKVRA